MTKPSHPRIGIVVDGIWWDPEFFTALHPKDSVVFNGRLLEWGAFERLLPTTGDIWYKGRHWDECWKPADGKAIFGRHL